MTEFREFASSSRKWLVCHWADMHSERIKQEYFQLKNVVFHFTSELKTETDDAEPLTL